LRFARGEAFRQTLLDTNSQEFIGAACAIEIRGSFPGIGKGRRNAKDRQFIRRDALGGFRLGRWPRSGRWDWGFFWNLAWLDERFHSVEINESRAFREGAALAK
jgi:hypothetical protein